MSAHLSVTGSEENSRTTSISWGLQRILLARLFLSRALVSPSLLYVSHSLPLYLSFSATALAVMHPSSHECYVYLDAQAPGFLLALATCTHESQSWSLLEHMLDSSDQPHVAC